MKKKICIIFVSVEKNMEQQYRKIYLSEVLEHLTFVNEALFLIKKGDCSNNTFNIMLRSIHAICGMSAIMNYVQTLITL